MSPAYAEPPPGRFPCHDCGKFFTSNRSLSNHSRSHKKKNKELFECDQCGSESGSRIKFNNHLKTHQDANSFEKSLPNQTNASSKVPVSVEDLSLDIKTEIEDQEPGDSDWPIVDMEDDEDLNEDNFDEMVRLFKNQEGQIKTEMPSDYGDADFDIKAEEQDYNDQSEILPFGWSVSTMETEFGENKVLVAPEGRLFYTYVEAVNYLMRDVEKMKKGFIEEGWEMNANLPRGWYLKLKKKGQLDYSFLTETFDQLNSPQEALHFMRKRGNYSQANLDVVSKYIENSDTSEMTPNVKKEKINNTDAQENIDLPKDIGLFLQANKEVRKRDITYVDRKLPKGWQAGYLKNSSRVSIIAPNNKSFPTTRSALRYMAKQLYSTEDKNIMAQNLKLDGWEKNEGGKWYSKNVCLRENEKPNIIYLSPEFRYFKTTKDAWDFAEKNYSSDQDDLKNDLLERINATKRRYRTVRYAWKAVDPTYPNGWKVRQVQESRTTSSEGRIRTYFLAPDGESFSRAISALQYMVSKPYNESEFGAMIKILNQDGYKSDEHLPRGWYFKTNRGSNGKLWDPFYCSENFEHHRSTKAAVNYMKANPQYSKKDIENLTLFADEKSHKLRQNKYDWIEGDRTLPKGWKIRNAKFSNSKYNKTYFLSPSGDSFSSLISAMRHMTSEKFPKEEISIMSKRLLKEGWKLDSRLPKGWRTRTITNGRLNKVQQYLTESFQMLKSMKAAFELIDSNEKYNLTDFKHFAWKNNELSGKENYENDLSQKESVEKKIEAAINTISNPEKSTIENNEIPSKSFKEENNDVSTNNTTNETPMVDFVTPDGKKFTSADTGLRHMLNMGCSDVQIKLMSQKLEAFGWEVDESLPKGWYKKYTKNGQRNGSKRNHIIFLSPKFERFTSRRSVIEYLEEDYYSTSKNQPFESNEIEKPKQNIEPKVDNSVPVGWKTELFEDKLYVISPKGNRFTSRVEALQYMINRNSPEESVETMREMLTFEDWLPNSHLPIGWRIQLGEKCRFLSKEGKIFESVTKAVEFMINNNLRYTYDDVTNIKMLQKKDDYSEETIEEESIENIYSEESSDETKIVMQEEEKSEQTKNIISDKGTGEDKESIVTPKENLDLLYQDIMIKLEDIPEEDLEKNPEEDYQEKNSTEECGNESNDEEFIKEKLESEEKDCNAESCEKQQEGIQREEGFEFSEIKLEVAEQDCSNGDSSNMLEESLERQDSAEIYGINGCTTEGDFINESSGQNDDINESQKRKVEEESYFNQSTEGPHEALNKRMKADENMDNFSNDSTYMPQTYVPTPPPSAYPTHPPTYPPFYQNSIYRQAPQLPYSSYWPRYPAYPPYSGYPPPPGYPRVNNYQYPAHMSSGPNPPRMPAYMSSGPNPSRMPAHMSSGPNTSRMPAHIPSDPNPPRIPAHMSSGLNPPRIPTQMSSGPNPSGMPAHISSGPIPPRMPYAFNLADGPTPSEISDGHNLDKIPVAIDSTQIPPELNSLEIMTGHNTTNIPPSHNPTNMPPDQHSAPVPCGFNPAGIPSVHTSSTDPNSPEMPSDQYLENNPTNFGSLLRDTISEDFLS